MDVDPAASMRCWAIEIELGGRTFTVPALPAADWWPVLEEANLLGVLDLLPDGGEVDDLILNGQLGSEGLTEALRSAVEQAAGRPAHTAIVLAAVAQVQWSVIGGELARHGFRWDVAPLGAALDAIYLTVVERLPKDKMTKFESILNNPMALSGKRGEVNRQRALNDFEEMAGPKPAPVKSSGTPSAGVRPKTQPRPRSPRPDAR